MCKNCEEHLNSVANNNHSKWHERFISIARTVSSWSKDRSTKHGCVIVDPNTRAILSTGYNGFPRDIDDDIDERHERPLKYSYTEHSERNAIFHCARAGVAIEGCHLYVTGWPCPDCCRAIIQSGIVQVFIDGASLDSDFDIRWKEVTTISKEMFNEAGINVTIV
jgi:dCMP deaminase